MTKTVYVCDVCGTQSDAPRSWISFTDPISGFKASTEFSDHEQAACSQHCAIQVFSNWLGVPGVVRAKGE